MTLYFVLEAAYHSSLPFMSQCLFPCKSGLTRGVRDNIVSFYYLGESEIWSIKRHSVWWERPYNRGTIT